MKIWKISYNVSKDDLLASKLSKEIFSIVNENIGKDIYREITVDNVCKLHLNTFNNQKELRYGTFDIRAVTHVSKNKLFDPSIRVALSFSNGFSQYNYEKLYGVIFDAIKHELGHYYQYNNKIDDMEDDDQEEATGMLDFCIKKKESLLSKKELIPYVKGIVFESKKMKKPFELALDENLNGLFFYNNNDFKKRVMSSAIWPTINQIIYDIRISVTNMAQRLYPYLRKKK